MHSITSIIKFVLFMLSDRFKIGSMPSILPRLLFIFLITSPMLSSGTLISSFITGSKRTSILLTLFLTNDLHLVQMLHQSVQLYLKALNELKNAVIFFTFKHYAFFYFSLLSSRISYVQQNLFR